MDSNGVDCADLLLPGLVLRGGLRRAEDRKICEPGLSQWPGLPDLRLRRSQCGAGAGAGSLKRLVRR